MGIVNCADEHIGTLPDDPKLDLHLGKDHSNSIYCLSMHVLKEAQESGRTTQQIALEMAEQRSFEIHPLYGHRGKQVIDALVKEDKWKGVN